MQLLDFTTLTAICAELRLDWIPARTEQVYQRDRHTICLGLRTLKQRGWLTICWHPQAARICLGDAPPRTPDTFTFSDQLRHQLSGLAMVGIVEIAPWERVLDIQFAKRPGEKALWHLYVEIMGKYSNVILTDADKLIITAAHQVSAQQSSIRPIQTGQPYELPPALTNTIPSVKESFVRWQERISLVPGALRRQLQKNYRGLSPALIISMIHQAGLYPEQFTDSLHLKDWQKLFTVWQEWVEIISNELLADTSTTLSVAKLRPGFTTEGYNVLGWGIIEPVENIQTLINRYYTEQLNQQQFNQLQHQLTQKIRNILAKLRFKETGFQEKLQQSDDADKHRQQADLLMAYLQNWQPGMKSINLSDFDTGKPVNIPLDPEKNAVQNAQSLYKRHQKLKRARAAVEPLLAEVQTEIYYLEQVEATLIQLEKYQIKEDLQTLEEIREELIAQEYLEAPEQRSRNDIDTFTPYRYHTPNGIELLIGRNNRQNDHLTFRIAGDYDLWFHTQEIPGSHGLLRIQPGEVAEEADLQFAADITAYYSRARLSEQVPVIYTEPKHVYKPKGAKPGMAIYKHERIIWGCPPRAVVYLKN